MLVAAASFSDGASVTPEMPSEVFGSKTLEDTSCVNASIWLELARCCEASATMAASRDREERGRLQEPSNRRNRLPDIIRVTMNDGSFVEINLTGANREEREDVARFFNAHSVTMAPPAAHRESRERSPRLAVSVGPTVRVTPPDVQERFRQLPSPAIASHGEPASDERLAPERAETTRLAQLPPQRCEGCPRSKASAVATGALPLPMSTDSAQIPSANRREKRP